MLIRIRTDEENDALLAAIRAYQNMLEGRSQTSEDVEDIATNDGQHAAPTPETFAAILADMGADA